jgi:hypothetical protein
MNMKILREHFSSRFFMQVSSLTHMLKKVGDGTRGASTPDVVDMMVS